MSSALEAVWIRLSEQFGIEAAERLVTRVDSRPVRGAGAQVHALTLELETAEGNRWFRLEQEALFELKSREDRKLPLVARWDAVAADGRIELLAWRPGRRMVTAHEREGGTVIVKALRKGRAERAAALHHIAASALDTGHVRAPHLRACDRRTESIVFECEEGRPLDLGAASAPGFFEIGCALRRMQSVRATDGLPLHGATDELLVLDGWMDKARRWTGSMPAGWLEAREELVRTPPPRAADGLVLAHRDLHDGQFVATSSGLVLLDFDLLCRADPQLDAANLTAHLTLRVLQGLAGATAASAEACRGSLLAGLQRGTEETPAFRFYLASTYLRLAALYSLRPRWRHLAPDLSALARQALASSGCV